LRRAAATRTCALARGAACGFSPKIVDDGSCDA
jgi:hypothetical protein